MNQDQSYFFQDQTPKIVLFANQESLNHREEVNTFVQHQSKKDQNKIFDQQIRQLNQNSSLPISRGQQGDRTPSRTLHRISKTNKGQKKPNKTKNMLQFFTKPHFKFCQMYASRHGISNFQELKASLKIFKGEHMSLEDYERAYIQEELKDCWQLMFRQKYLYRCLMLGRILNAQRKVFEKAFRLGKFRKIR